MEDVLYHYTDANAFMNILEKGRLFATNIAYMNDTGASPRLGFMCERDDPRALNRTSARSFVQELPQ